MTAPEASPRTIARSNVNSWWGSTTAELLWRLGVRTVVVSPGSRSTPLTFTCAAHGQLEIPVVLDERSGAFYALGLAKARHETIALVCTSGTAVVNYLPAIVEAAESGTSLLVLTADRPPELRHRHAGQTIDQVKVFGDAVRFYAEAPVPEPHLELLQSWRDLLAQAVRRSRGDSGGPVHVNCPFREPLAPGKSEDSSLPEIPAGFWACAQASPEPQVTLRLPTDLPRAGWIVAGPILPVDPARYVAAVGELASRLGWPIIADALNPCRHYPVPSDLPIVCGYDTFLRNPEVREAVRPEGILQLGELPTSKVLRQALCEWQLPTWIVDPAPDSRNAVAAPAVALSCGAESLEVGPRRQVATPPETLLKMERAVQAALVTALDEAEALLEPRIARTLLTSLPAETPIFVASSMPVRDAEYFWTANDDRRPVFFNRGANGIDGTLSSALGVAAAKGRPAVLYTGELALLHDTNGLLIANTHFAGSLTIVCINNGGGGIFEHLPIASHGDIFETCFATPQRLDFERWASAYGIEYARIASLAGLRDFLADLPESGVRLLEVRTDRKRDAAWRRSTFAQLAASLS